MTKGRKRRTFIFYNYREFITRVNLLSCRTKLIEIPIDDSCQKWRHFKMRDPDWWIFFVFSSLSFSFPVSTCLWFAALFCTSDELFWASRSSRWRGHGRMKSEVISYRFLRSDFLFHFPPFFLSLLAFSEQATWKEVERRSRDGAGSPFVFWVYQLR